MTSTGEKRRRIDVEGSVRVDGPAGPFFVNGEGRSIRVRLARLGQLRSFASLLRASRAAVPIHGEPVERFPSWFDLADVVVRVEVGPHLVARLGAGVRRSRLLRWFGVAPAELRPLALCRALIANR